MPDGGIRVHSEHSNAYQEVSGYIVPTLLYYGERSLADRVVSWLIRVQQPDGAFVDPDAGRPIIFDTGQALRGLLASAARNPEALNSARKAATYLRDQMIDGGRGGFGNRYGGTISEAIHLYVLPPLLEAAEVLNDRSYRLGAEQCLEHYLNHPDALRIRDLTHFLAYQLEALIDLNRPELALPLLDKLAQSQRRDGAVNGIPGCGWVCTPGLAQLAICWYKTGNVDAADRAVGWLDAHQRTSGGFLGCYGRRKGYYFPRAELSWAAKYYLDAHALRLAAHFNRQAHLFPEEIPIEDGRIQAVRPLVAPGSRIVELGCGKGRFLKALAQACPGIECTGVDISEVMLRSLSPEFKKVIAPLESVPLPDAQYDVVFAVEAIEHSSNQPAVIEEMARLARPGGWIIIIDKQQSQNGRMQTESWERWPALAEMSTALASHCSDVTARSVGYDGRDAADGLMIAWTGRKAEGLPR